jgi:hypothetical protein
MLFSAFVIYAALSDAVELWTNDWKIIVSFFFIIIYTHNMSIPSWVSVDGLIRIYRLRQPKPCKVCSQLLDLKQFFENATLSRNVPRRSVVKSARMQYQAVSLKSAKVSSTEHVHAGHRSEFMRFKKHPQLRKHLEQGPYW